jgi:hypothetical protein
MAIRCSLCKSTGTNAINCPLNGKACFPDYSKHYLSIPNMSGAGFDINDLYSLPDPALKKVIDNLDFYEAMIACDAILSDPKRLDFGKRICTNEFFIQKRKYNDPTNGQAIYKLIKEAIDDENISLLNRIVVIANSKNTTYMKNYAKKKYGKNLYNLYLRGYKENNESLYEYANHLGGNINSGTPNLFSLAIEDGNEIAARRLLELGVNINYRKLENLLYMAIHKNFSIGFTKLLIDLECESNYSYRNETSVEGKMEIKSDLIGSAPLKAAIETNNLEMLKMLLSEGGYRTGYYYDDFGGEGYQHSLLYYAKQYNNKDMMDFLEKTFGKNIKDTVIYG